jgi:hypothetical protein
MLRAAPLGAHKRLFDKHQREMKCRMSREEVQVGKRAASRIGDMEMYVSSEGFN